MTSNQEAIVTQSPSARLVDEAGRERDVVDATGRVLRIRRPGALDRLRLFKAVGPALAHNDRYIGYAMLAMCVVSIDGVPHPTPTNEGQLEGLVQRIGDTGMAAIGQELANASQGNR